MSKEDNYSFIWKTFLKLAVGVGGSIATAYTTHKLVEGNTRGKAMKKALKENNPEDGE